jgi:serine/threonine protein phosphatase PrpC
MAYKISIYAQSDPGLVRQNNEDAWVAIPESRLFILADGMGGHRAGEIAAKEAIESLSNTMTKLFQSKPNLSLQEARQALQQAIEQANHLVYRLSRREEHLKGMGTTLCCVYFHEEGVICAHVGDSRIYRLRKGKLDLLTVDHSLVRELIDLGQLNEAQAPNFLYKNILTRAIGTEPTVEPSLHVEKCVQGDIYLICSDGLSDMLTHSQIAMILNRTSTIEDAGKSLISAAKQRGGHDNITVVMMQVQESHETSPISR